MKPTLDTPLTNQEVDDLDAFLLQSGLDAPMDISMLDGFLCAVLSAPRQMPPTQWMPWIWDYEAAEQVPQFANDKNAKHVASLVMRFAREIALNLEHALDEFEPLFPERETETGSEFVIDDWCFGFLKAISLDPGAWQPLLDEHPDWFVTLNLYGTEAGWKRLEEEIETLPDADVRHSASVAAIAPALRLIYCYWQAVRGSADVALPAAPVPARNTAKPARNAPCPCGSGRKYKACHGAAA
jgi:uncharacterized protein